MKKLLLLTALLICGISAINAQEVGVYESNYIRQAETGIEARQTSIFTITKTKIIIALSNSSAEFTFTGNPPGRSGSSIIYEYYHITGNRKVAFEFIKNESGYITQINMYQIVSIPNSDADAGRLKLDFQFLIADE